MRKKTFTEEQIALELRDASAFGVHAAEVVLGFGMSLLGQWLEKSIRCRVVPSFIGGDSILEFSPGR